MPVLRADPLTTTWLPEDGMVGASFTHEGEELLGQRGGLGAYGRRALRSEYTQQPTPS